MKLLNFFKPKTPKPTIESYGQPTEVSSEVQALIEWLFASLIAVRYFGRSHLVWYDNNLDPSLEKLIKKLIRCDEPIFLHRCGDRAMTAPQGYYWRMMSEHLSMQVYQLEVKDE